MQAISITNDSEHWLALKMIKSYIFVSQVDDFIVILTDTSQLLVYTLQPMFQMIDHLFNDPLIIKYTLYGKDKFGFKKANFTRSLSRYIKERGNWKLFTEFKNRIIACSAMEDPLIKGIKLVNIMAKYKSLSEKETGNIGTYNRKRDSYLAYLTIFNMLLSQHQELSVNELILLTIPYIKLCSKKYDMRKVIFSLISMELLQYDNGLVRL